MQQVISAEQARKITGGRKPLVPIVYEEALKALDACVTLDEAKYWDNKADALAAWAKIYHDDEVNRKAAALKIWAHRRMGEIAAEIRPGKRIRRENGRHAGQSPGPRSLLVESGLTLGEADAARALARAKPEEVKRLMELPRPPSPITCANPSYYSSFSKDARLHKASSYGGINPSSKHSEWPPFWNAISLLARRLTSVSASVLASSVEETAISKVRERVLEVIGWLDEFEQRLPKSTVDGND